GAAHERLDEAPRDLAGAIAALRDRGYTRFVLGGQSLGTVKVAYTQANAPFDGVVGVVLRSGPRFAQAVFEARLGEPFAEGRRLAERHVAAGEPEALLAVDVPLPGPWAAAAYLDKYGPHGRYDWIARLESISVPKLILLGGADPLPLVQAARETVEGWAAPPD